MGFSRPRFPLPPRPAHFQALVLFTAASRNPPRHSSVDAVLDRLALQDQARPASLQPRPLLNQFAQQLPAPRLVQPRRHRQPPVRHATMNQIPDYLYAGQDNKTWLVVGASRGIGLEFVRQLLARGDRIIATVRETFAAHASALWGQAGSDHGRCSMHICDVLSEENITNFVAQIAAIPNLKIDYVVLNAGVLRYPNRSTEFSFDEFAFHLHTNTIGPIITAQKLLQTNIPIGLICFMSSDSGSQGNFREMEDGFAAYAASKAALNMAVRHMAAELKRKDDDTIILAMHPGEVATDMANITLTWPVEGIISPEVSVSNMIQVIESKGIQHSGTFWTWENKPYVW